MVKNILNKNGNTEGEVFVGPDWDEKLSPHDLDNRLWSITNSKLGIKVIWYDEGNTHGRIIEVLTL